MDQALAAAKDAYVNGEIDFEEFERRIDTTFELAATMPRWAQVMGAVDPLDSQPWLTQSRR